MTQPISYVSGDEPPALLVTGGDGKTVEPGNTCRLARRLRLAGGEVEVMKYAAVGHLGIISAFAFPLRFLAPIVKDVDAIINKVTSDRTHRGV